MDTAGRKSDLTEEYWQQKYFDVLAQNRKLREENKSLRTELDSVRLSLQETQRQLEESLRAPSAVQSSALSPRLGDTFDLSRSNIEQLLSLVCTSQSSINLSLSTMFSSRHFNSSLADTLNQRSKEPLDPQHVELFRIESVSEREEESIELQDSQSRSDRMYEEFMVLGLSTFAKGVDNPAEVLLQHPNQEFLKGSAQHSVIPEFAYPSGCTARILSLSESASDINELLYGQSNLTRNANFFVFTIKSTDQNKPSSSRWSDANKDKLSLYCVCLKYDDMVLAKDGQWVYQKCLCLVSYHPCFELHFEVLTKMLAVKRLTRMNVLASQKSGATYSLSMLSRIFKSSDDLNDEERFLLDQYAQLSPTAGQRITIPLSTVDSVNYLFPSISQMDVEWNCPPFFSSVRFQDLFWLVCAVLLEKSVVFTSSNTGLLTASVLSLLALIRPFSWPYVIIPIIPMSLIELLEAPMPIIAGLSPYPGLNLKNHKNLIWVNLDEPNIDRKICVYKEISREVREPYGSNMKSELAIKHKAFSASKTLFNPLSEQKHEAVQMAQIFFNCWDRFAAFVELPPPLMPGSNLINVEQMQALMLRSAPKPDRKFLEAFVASQVFLSHIEERMKMLTDSRSSHSIASSK